jgi:hypothetical protein
MPAEGFKGERTLTLVSVGLGIISTLLIIKVMSMQHEFFKQKLEDQKNGKA